MNKNLQNLFLIGGGIMRKGEAMNLDKWLVKKASKNENKPKVLFVPTASRDLPEYVTDFKKRYFFYGATVDVLLLAAKDLPKGKVRQKLLSANLIYFGGGDMDFAFEKFKKYGIEEILDQAAQRGTLVGGLSAGASMFGKTFLNFDWNGVDFSNFRLNKGYGWVNFMIWTHFSSKFLGNKEAISALDSNTKLLGVGDEVLVYWDKENNMRVLKEKNSGECVVGKFYNSEFRSDPAPNVENVNRNL